MHVHVCTMYDGTVCIYMFYLIYVCMYVVPAAFTQPLNLLL